MLMHAGWGSMGLQASLGHSCHLEELQRACRQKGMMLRPAGHGYKQAWATAATLKSCCESDMCAEVRGSA